MQVCVCWHGAGSWEMSEKQEEREDEEPYRNRRDTRSSLPGCEREPREERQLKFLQESQSINPQINLISLCDGM